MIRLFNSTETDFTHDGVEVLDDIVISSFTDWKENSKWIIEAKFKKDLDKSGQLKNGMILKVPTEKGEQLFRVLKTNKKNRKFITVYGHAIGHSFNDNFIQDINIVEKSGRVAMQQISAGTVEKHRYNLSSNIDTVASARMVRKNGIDALLGDKENSFSSRWGGYLVLDNFNIAMNSSIGTDKGVEIAIGKNVIQYDGTIDEAPVVTGINAITYDGLTLPEGIYYSPLAGNYANKKIKEFKFDSIKYKYSNNNTNEEGYETLEEVYEAIRKACDDLFNVSNIDKPTCSLRVDIAALEHTDQYKGDELNERIFQGDILTANLDDYGFDVKLKMVANRYDNVRNKYIDIDLGDAKSNALSDIGKVENIIDKVVDQLGGNTWQDIIDKSMQEASQLIAEGIKDSYVVARKNEILIMDSPEVESAINVIRMNKNGIAFSQSGYNGPYTVAITIDGKINANCIMTGELNAALIKAGILSDATGKFSLNMDTGQFRFENSIIGLGDNGVQVRHNQSDTHSEMSSEGFKVYKNDGKELASFGENNKAIINEVETNIINSATVIPQLRNKGDLSVYVSSIATGDMTGKNDSNRANSIITALSYLFGTYGLNWGTVNGMILTNTSINIYVQGSGSYTENIYLRDFLGEGLINFIISKDLELTGTWSFSNCKRIYMNGNRTSQSANDGARFKRNGSYDSLYFHSCLNVELINFRFYSSIQSHSGLSCRYGSNVYVATCDFYGGNHAIYLDSNSKCHTYKTSGHGFGTRAYTINQGCVMIWERTTPVGGKASFLSGWGTDTKGEGVASTESNSVQVTSPPPPVDQVFTQDFTPLNYRSERPVGTQNGTFKQGYWESQWGNYTGYANFGSTIKNWLSNAQGGVTMQVYLQRINDSHGYASGVPVILSGNNVGTLARGEGKWFNVPASIVTSLQNGGELVANGTGQTQYIKFETNIKLRVTATKPA